MGQTICGVDPAIMLEYMVKKYFEAKKKKKKMFEVNSVLHNKIFCMLSRRYYTQEADVQLNHFLSLKTRDYKVNKLTLEEDVSLLAMDIEALEGKGTNIKYTA